MPLILQKIGIANDKYMAPFTNALILTSVESIVPPQ